MIRLEKSSGLLTGQVSSVGVPITENIRESWSRSVSPGRNGTRRSSSASMQPTAHISTLVPYIRAPYSNSGALEKKFVRSKTRQESVKGIMSQDNLPIPSGDYLMSINSIW